MTYNAYAKINLTLDIVGKRDDGYHNISSVMQTISLCDKLTIDVSRNDGEKSSITVTSTDKDLPTDSKNLCYRACALFFDKFAMQGINVRIHIEKNIPVGAGLGGGSSDCAATLKALNKIFKLNATDETLEKIGGKIGSDVPFFIKGGCLKAEGTGDILSGPYSSGDVFIALFMPKKMFFSGEIYKEFDDLFEKESSLFPKPSTDLFLSSKNRWKYVSNMLAYVSEKRLEEISIIKKKFISLGAPAAEMSGSGPAVFAVFRTKKEAENALTELKDHIPAGFCGVFKPIKL